jgi:hypothetical protein
MKNNSIMVKNGEEIILTIFSCIVRLEYLNNFGILSLNHFNKIMIYGENFKTIFH